MNNIREGIVIHECCLGCISDFHRDVVVRMLRLKDPAGGNSNLDRFNMSDCRDNHK